MYLRVAATVLAFIAVSTRFAAAAIGYRLAELYAELGRKQDCLKILKWLEVRGRRP